MIDLEPADGRRRPDRAAAGLGAKQVAAVMAALLAAVLAGGALAGRPGSEPAGRPVAFQEPAPPPATGAESGAGESAAPIGAGVPTRPPHHIPDGWLWRTVGPLPPRVGNIGVWTGREVVYWGGDRPGRAPEGAAYAPESNRWRRLSRAPLTNRSDAVAVWTGREVVIFGGINGAGPQGDGAAYDPNTDRWRTIAPGPLSGRVPLAVAWTGTEMLVVGARGPGLFDGLQDAAAYDPARDTWRALPGLPMQINDGASAWTGTELVVYGTFLDRQGSLLAPDNRARGAALDPATGHWRDLLAAPLSGQAIAVVWDGSEVVAWDHDLHSAAYAPEFDAWRELPDVPLEGRDCLPAGVAAGGFVFATQCGQAALFDPHRREWQAVPAPATAIDSPVWTGDGLVQWLGASGRPSDGTWFRPMAPMAPMMP